jgi:hypothetical protein
MRKPFPSAPPWPCLTAVFWAYAFAFRTYHWDRCLAHTDGHVEL